ncbi:dihydrolipoamide acyltransferase [Histomonas meleagridis]|uniref:dihydrolipoamide acyltransferase n=1 Tax=Histomonas meleagridis TaxID=135588 RepID=UPI00355A832F|nr:dihydrolipoamide acyltransferase [Histomonas meleagridis]KAH0807097.1 dihydrolipoamide acyltransferase [Histomonas meleagridis]
MIIPKRTYNPTGIQGDDVLSTSDLVRFSELVSSDWLESALDKNHSSVGAFVDLDHIAPAYIDDTILTKATITKVAPRKISYRITTTNPSTNELIGICKHNRVIIRFN